MQNHVPPEDDQFLNPRTEGENSAHSEPTAPMRNTVTQYNPTYAPPPPPPPPPTVALPARGSAARDRMRQRRVNGNKNNTDWAWVIIALALLSVVIVISLSLTLLLRASQNQQEALPTDVALLPTPVDGRMDFSNVNISSVSSGDQLTLDDGRNIVLEPWDGESRFTVLVMGMDRRPGETGLAFRTDTMMLVSIDPATKSVGILSIPRDLFVETPGYGLQRVNSPMVLGELQREGYGPELAMETVQYNLGMRVHDYVVVDFDAVITMIDVVGGIDVDVPNNISDPQYPNMWYGYDPLFIPAGFHHMNGEQALKYARTRHSSSDFERAKRQQQVVFAVRERVLENDMLPSLIVQAPSIWANLSDNMSTGLSLDQMIQLGWYLKDIPTENIRTGVLNQQYVMPFTTSTGAAVLIPNRSTIGPLLVEIFGENYAE